MIEAVSTSPVLNTALRSASQGGANASLPPVSAPPKLGSTRIYVNNLQNVAVFQQLDGNGTVTAQYPTETQIQAFRAAEALATAHTELTRLTSSADQVSSGVQDTGNNPAAALGVSSSGGGASSADTSAQAPAAPSVSNILEAMTTASYSPSGGSTASAQDSQSQASTSVVV